MEPSDLVRLANRMDSLGRYREAQALDEKLTRLAIDWKGLASNLGKALKNKAKTMPAKAVRNLKTFNPKNLLSAEGRDAMIRTVGNLNRHLPDSPALKRMQEEIAKGGSVTNEMLSAVEAEIKALDALRFSQFQAEMTQFSSKVGLNIQVGANAKDFTKNIQQVLENPKINDRVKNTLILKYQNYLKQKQDRDQGVKILWALGGSLAAGVGASQAARMMGAGNEPPAGYGASSTMPMTAGPDGGPVNLFNAPQASGAPAMSAPMSGAPTAALGAPSTTPAALSPQEQELFDAIKTQSDNFQKTSVVLDALSYTANPFPAVHARILQEVRNVSSQSAPTPNVPGTPPASENTSSGPFSPTQLTSPAARAFMNSGLAGGTGMSLSGGSSQPSTSDGQAITSEMGKIIPEYQAKGWDADSSNYQTEGISAGEQAGHYFAGMYYDALSKKGKSPQEARAFAESELRKNISDPKTLSTALNTLQYYVNQMDRE